MEQLEELLSEFKESNLQITMKQPWVSASNNAGQVIAKMPSGRFSLGVATEQGRELWSANSLNRTELVRALSAIIRARSSREQASPAIKALEAYYCAETLDLYV